MESSDHQLSESNYSRDIDEETAKEWDHTLLQNSMDKKLQEFNKRLEQKGPEMKFVGGSDVIALIHHFGKTILESIEDFRDLNYFLKIEEDNSIECILFSGDGIIDEDEIRGSHHQFSSSAAQNITSNQDGVVIHPSNRVQELLKCPVCTNSMYKPIHQVATTVEFKDQPGEQQTMPQNLQNLCLKTRAPMESHAATVFTPFAFSKLHEQLVLDAQCALFQTENGSQSNFVLTLVEPGSLLKNSSENG